MNAAVVVIGVFTSAAVLILLIGAMGSTPKWGERRRYRRIRKLRARAHWRDHYRVEGKQIVVTLQNVAETRLGEVVVDELTFRTVSMADPMWGMKLRSARLEAWDRAVELNAQPLSFTD